MINKGVTSFFCTLATALSLICSAFIGAPAVASQKGSPIGVGDYITQGLPVDATNLVEVSCGQAFTLGLRDDGRVVGWGWSQNGGLSIPADLPKVRHIAAGFYFGTALTESGDVRVWGAFGHVSQQAIVTPPSSVTNIVAIAGGMAHCLALRADGQVIAWGNEIFDDLVVPPTLTNATLIAAGQTHSIALTSVGTIVGWGNNSYYKFSTKPSALNSPVAFSLSPYGFTLGLNSDGHLYGWGDNTARELSFPVTTGIVAIAAGGQHGAAITTNGNLVSWGDNTYGQSAIPAGFPKVFALSAGERFTAALTRAPVVLNAPYSVAAYAGHDLEINVDVLASDEWQAQWYCNGVLVPSRTSAKFLITDAQGANAGTYTMTATNSFGATKTGDIFVTITPSPLDWITQPASAGALPGSTAEFRAQARGSEPISYQWFHDGAPIPNSDTNRLVLASVGLADEGVYWAVATNALSTTNSAPAYFTASTAKFIAQPADQRVRPGWNVALNANAVSPTAMELQWLHNGAEIPGANNFTLPLTAIHDTDVGTYQLRIHNAAGDTFSRITSLEIVPDGLPAGTGGVAVLLPGAIPDLKGEVFKPTDLIETAAGQGFIIGLHDDGTTEGWSGFGSFQPFPAAATNIISIDSASDYALALRDDGKVFGYFFGIPDTIEQVVQISAGEHGALVVKKDGTVLSIGGAQPDGITNIVNAAVNVEAVAVQSDGRVLCWNTWYPSTTPAYYARGLTNAIAVACSEYQNYALRRDGTLVTWSRVFPDVVELPGISNVVELQLGLARTASGQLISISGTPLPPRLTAASIGRNSAVSILPFFDSHPADQVAYAGGSVTINAEVRGPGSIDYQWFHDDTAIPNATSPALTLSNLRPHDAGKYFLRAHNANGVSDSLAMTFAVHGPPEITSEPSVISVAAGNEGMLTLQVASSSKATFQWYFEGLPLENAVSNVFRIPNAQTWNAGNYSVSIANDYGETLSAPIQLVVTPTAPTFVLQPTNVSVHDGSLQTFEGRAIGSEPISYQWLHSGLAIPNATNARLQIANVQSVDAGTYTLIAANSVGTNSVDVELDRIQSPLQVRTVPAFALARVGRPLRLSTQIVLGTEAGALEYQWKHNGTNLPAHTGSELIIDPVAETDAGEYAVSVRNTLGEVESARAQVTILKARTPGILRSWGGRSTARTPAGIFADTAAQGINFGSALLQDGSITAWGTLGPAPITPPPAFSNLVAIAAGDATLFGLRNDGRALVWQSAGLIEAPALTNLVSIAAGSSHVIGLRADGSFTVWGGVPALTNAPVGATNVAFISAAGSRNFVMRKDGTFFSWGNAVSGTLQTTPVAANNVIAIAATTTQNAALRDDGFIVVWGGTATVPGNSNFVALASGQGHFVALRRDGSVALWGSGSDGQLTKPADVTNILSIAAGTVSSHAIVATPMILTQPIPMSVAVGAPFSLSVNAIGTPTLAYQWYQNGTAIAGANSSRLETNASVNGAGNYTVIVSNLFASTKSGNYIVGVGIPPAIAAPPLAQIKNLGDSATFTVTATGTPPFSYQWYLNGNALVGGTGNSLTLTNLLTVDRGQWTVFVSNPFGSALSPPAELIIGKSGAFSSTFGSLNSVGDAFAFKLSIEPDAIYRLQSSSNLVDWQTDQTFSVRATVFDFNLPKYTNGQHFYRVISP